MWSEKMLVLISSWPIYNVSKHYVYMINMQLQFCDFNNNLTCWLSSAKNFQQRWITPLCLLSEKDLAFVFSLSRILSFTTSFPTFEQTPCAMLHPQSCVKKKSLKDYSLTIYPRELISTVFYVFLGTEPKASNVLDKCPIPDTYLSLFFFGRLYSASIKIL